MERERGIPDQFLAPATFLVVSADELLLKSKTFKEKPMELVKLNHEKLLNPCVCVLFLSIFLLFLAPTPSYAKNATTSLNEIVVTASRFKEMKKEVTANISVINEDEIKLSTANDLGELLAEKNVGYIGKRPGTLTPIGIRGFRTGSHGGDLNGKVLVLLNGRRSGTGNTAKIMTENIERVEIIRGPASVQYGSAAIGGVVNVITKQGKEEPSVSVKGVLGSYGFEQSSASFSGKVDNFDFSGSVTRSKMDDYSTADGKKYHNTGYDEKLRSSFNVGYEFFPNNRIGIIGNYFDANELGMPGYISKNDKNDYTEKSSESLDVVYDGATMDNLFQWKTRYFFGNDEANWYRVNPDSTSHNKRDTDQEGIQAQFTWSPGCHELTAGMDWVNYEIDNTMKPKTIEYDNPSYFLLGKAKYLNKSLIFTGGIRYDEYEVDMKQWGGIEDDNHISPKLGLSYLPVENIKLRVNYAQGFKMPTARQLAGNYERYGKKYAGNANLDPETSDTYQAGIDIYYNELESSLSYFYTDFEDKIEDVSRDDGVQTWENVGKATVSGFEGEVSYDLATIGDFDWQFKPYFNFTCLTEYEDEETGEDLLNTSDLKLSYGLIFSDFNGFSSQISFSYVGEQRVQDYENWNYMTPDPEKIEKGGFTVTDVSIEKRIGDFSSYGDLTLRGEINNLLDKNYSYVKGYPMPGRSFYLGLRYDI